MNTDDFAARVMQRLSDPVGASGEMMTLDEIHQLTTGDVEALKNSEFAAWVDMVNENIDHFEQIADQMRQQNAEFRTRIEAGRDYPGAVQSMKMHIPENEIKLAVWEAMISTDGHAELERLINTPEGGAAYDWWRSRHCFNHESRAARHYNRISGALMTWYCITGGRKHAPV